MEPCGANCGETIVERAPATHGDEPEEAALGAAAASEAASTDLDLLLYTKLRYCTCQKTEQNGTTEPLKNHELSIT